jgi:rubrerythrin
MKPVFDLASVDADGAIREAEEAVAGDTRAAFFRKAAIGGGTVLGGGAIMGMLPQLAIGAPSKKQDLAILNFALTLEFLEAEFYALAVKHGSSFGAQARNLAATIAGHEAAHVQALRKTIKSLGGKPVAKPTFDFMDTTRERGTFLKTAFVLENTGVHAYLGQAGNLQSKALLAAAASIVTIEARHAAAVATLSDKTPFGDKGSGITPDGAFDTPLSKDEVLAAVGKTGFIKG